MTAKNTPPLIEPFLLLNNSDGCFKVLLSQITYCNSYNSSTVFHITGKPDVVIAKPIIYYEKALRGFGFVRIHHSTIINITYLCRTGKGTAATNLTLTTGEQLIISRPKKNNLMSALLLLSAEPTLNKTKKQVKPIKKQVSHKKIQHSHKLKSKNKK